MVAPRVLEASKQQRSDSFPQVANLRDHLHRYWFEFGGPRDALPPGGWLGSGVTAADLADAQRLLVEGPFREGALRPVERLVEDVDVSELDAGHVIPNMGDPTLRGVWFPRF
jgi:hypothetical protein